AEAQRGARKRTVSRAADLHQPEAPPPPLGQVLGHALRSQTGAQGFLLVHRFPAGPVEMQGEQKILGDAVGREPADLLQSGYPDYRGGAAAEGGTPAVL